MMMLMPASKLCRRRDLVSEFFWLGSHSAHRIKKRCKSTAICVTCLKNMAKAWNASSGAKYWPKVITVVMLGGGGSVKVRKLWETKNKSRGRARWGLYIATPNIHISHRLYFHFTHRQDFRFTLRLGVRIHTVGFNFSRCGAPLT